MTQLNIQNLFLAICSKHFFITVSLFALLTPSTAAANELKHSPVIESPASVTNIDKPATSTLFSAPSTSTPISNRTQSDKFSKPYEIPRRKGFTWDAQLEAGILMTGRPEVLHRGCFKGRVGAMLVREPWFWSLGATGEVWGQSEAAGGLEFEVTHLWAGLWGQIGAGVTKKSDIVSHGALGWSVLGVEYQRVFISGGDDYWAVMAKIKVPIGILVFCLTVDDPPGV